MNNVNLKSVLTVTLVDSRKIVKSMTTKQLENLVIKFEKLNSIVADELAKRYEDTSIEEEPEFEITDVTDEVSQQN